MKIRLESPPICHEIRWVRTCSTLRNEELPRQRFREGEDDGLFRVFFRYRNNPSCGLELLELALQGKAQINRDADLQFINIRHGLKFKGAENLIVFKCNESAPVTNNTGG